MAINVSTKDAAWICGKEKDCMWVTKDRRIFRRVGDVIWEIDPEGAKKK